MSYVYAICTAMNIQTGELFFTDSAAHQILLMLRHDYTLEGHLFRIRIGGKGCRGFTYETGLDYKRDNDFVGRQHFSLLKEDLLYLLDPFTKFYLKNGRIDYLLNPETQEEGFIVINHDEHDYVGKFFKDEELAPSHLEI